MICHAGHVCHGSLLGCCSSFCCLRLASQQSLPLALPQLTVQLLILCLHQLTLPFDLRQGSITTRMLPLQVAVACSGGGHLKVAVCVLTSSKASSVTGTYCFEIVFGLRLWQNSDNQTCCNGQANCTTDSMSLPCIVDRHNMSAKAILRRMDTSMYIHTSSNLQSKRCKNTTG